MHDWLDCSLLVASCLLRFLNFICFKTTNGGICLFSVITGKVLRVFMKLKFFLQRMVYYTLTNVMAIFCIKIQNLVFVFAHPIVVYR